MPGQFPEIEPFDHGFIDAGDGHEVYWERCGNPNGVPALYLHGGPGSGCSPGQRQFFDPDRFHAVLFDQRGCGRSRPLAEDDRSRLATNTTHHLIRDVEALREMLGIDRWVVLGLSWGTTLGLAYAQRHPDRIRGLVLGLVTTTSSLEVEWLTEGVGRIFPQQWHRFASAVPEGLRHYRLVDAYAEMLGDPDAEVRARAAAEWCAWEDAHISLAPGHHPNPRFADPDFRLRFATLVTHYWRHAAFLEGEQLLRDARRLDGIPGVLIHGRYDVSSPLETAWKLSRTWEGSELVVLEDAGHGGGDTLMGTILSALDRLSH